MIKKLLVITLTLIIYINLKIFGQQIVNAKVLDKDKPIVSATITLWDIKLNQKIEIFSSNADGITIIKSNTFLNKELRVSSIGYKEERIKLKDTAYQSVSIYLQSISNSLKEISIASKKSLIERKTDKLIFKVENSLSTIGSNAFEALSKAPGVRTDDNSISIIGRGSVGLMINSRFLNLSGSTLVNYLRTINAEEIKQIEIITNPSSKYEATGNSGLINIVMKKDVLLGYNGSISTGILVGKYATTGLTNLFSYNINKLHINSNLTGSLGKNYSYSNGFFDRPDVRSEDLLTNRSSRKNIRGSLSMDYDYSKSTSFGIKLEQVDYGSRNKNTRYLTYRSDKIDSSIFTPGINKENSNNSSVYFYLEHQLDTSGKKLDFDMSYLAFDNNNRNEFQSQLVIGSSPGSLESLKTFNNQSITILSSKLDFTYPTKLINLEYGAKASYIQANNQLDYYSSSFLPDGQNNVFDYNEQLFALYFSAQKEFKFWDVKVGLRAENTQTNLLSTSVATVFKRNYINLFPTIYLNYKVDESRTIGLAYGRRINRPYFDFLNPAQLYLSKYNIEQGTPTLKPSFIHNIEINFNTNKFQTALYAFILKDGFSSITLLDPNTTLSIQSPLNFIDINKFGLNESYTFDKLDWLESNNEFNLYFEKDYLNSALAVPRSAYISAYLSTDNTIVWNKAKTIRANFRFSYQFPERTDLDTRKGFYQLNMGLSASLLKKKLTLALNGNDILRTGYVISNGIANNVKRRFEYYTDNRTFRLSIVYRYGSNKNNKRFRDSSMEESDRIKRN